MKSLWKVKWAVAHVAGTDRESGRFQRELARAAAARPKPWLAVCATNIAVATSASEVFRTPWQKDETMGDYW